MRRFLALLLLVIPMIVAAQNSQPTKEQIRAKMQQIRQNTNWDDPAAAKKANEEIRKLSGQLSGNPAPPETAPASQAAGKAQPGSVSQKLPAATRENVVAIATRFYERSFRTLDAISRTGFEMDFKAADAEDFSLKAVRKLSSKGGTQISLGDDHNLACVYFASAVRAMPDDTLSVNNFGAYLRIIDSAQTSLPVLLYANKLYGSSPIVLTQIGCSYYELNDLKQAEFYLKEALRNDPDFSQAHTALCDLYIKQGRLQDALLELFAGVKGMGGSYRRNSNNFQYLKQQAEKAGTQKSFAEELRKQITPEDAIAPLVPEVNRIKMPGFPSCLKLADWIEGGGYGLAVQSINSFHGKLKNFTEEFQQVHRETPVMGPNAVIRDYPNERLALDCITEYFFQESDKEYDNFREKVDEIMKQVNDESEAYFQKKEEYTKSFVSCSEGCGGEAYCLQECQRVYCTRDCPETNVFNGKLQSFWEDYLAEFRKTQDNQKKILNDLYEFSGQWFSRINSPYWSRIYAYEIQRVALSIIGNAYTAYTMPFPGPVHSLCGQDCSVYANPYPIPAGEVEEKKPKENNCPEDKKFNLGLDMCSISFDCESVELGCAEGMAFSIKRNFKNKSTTAFVGVGYEKSFGFAKAGATAGFTMTRYDNGDLDVGVKGEVTATTSGTAYSGKNYEGNITMMEGLKTEAKDVIGIGF
jgi:tetratricopeptide (TPR) repeat protein